MIALSTFSGNLNSFEAKAWNLADQVHTFSGNFTPSATSLASIIEPIIIPFGYTSITLKPGHIIEGIDISECLMNESLEYFQKALYNFNCHYLLAQKGYNTWASVTNYYSSYFSIFSLLCLQGRIITRVKLDGINPIPCIIYPIDFRNHKYVITTSGLGATHKFPWARYYDIYNQYPCLKPEFDVIQLRAFVSDPIDESEERNKINYKIYEGFQEVININDINSFKIDYAASISTPPLGDILDNYLYSLHSLATDPGFKYFARSALRLVLIKTLYNEIGAVNPQFKAEYTSRVPIWQSTLFDIYQPLPINYYENFINTLLV